MTAIGELLTPADRVGCSPDQPSCPLHYSRLLGSAYDRQSAAGADRTRTACPPVVSSPSIPHMAFSWDNLISAAAGVVGGIGGGVGTTWLRGRYDDRRDRRATAATQADRRRDAYADLVKTARLALRNFRQLRLAYAASTPDTPEVTEAFTRAGGLAEDLNRAAAVAEILGSDNARTQARAVYDHAKACGDFYQTYSITLAEVQRNLGTKIPVAEFDAGKAAKLCDDLADAIDAFAEAVRQETAPPAAS